MGSRNEPLAVHICRFDEPAAACRQEGRSKNADLFDDRICAGAGARAGAATRISSATR